MQRVKLEIQYDGTNYCGWQTQPNKKTVQQTVENAVRLALGEECSVFASGRTDAGVHAFCQVAHFDTNTKFNTEKLWAIINRFLPDDVQILNSTAVGADFDARKSAKRKTYEYSFYKSIVDLPLYKNKKAKVRTDFDLKKAKKALPFFVGEHDFSAFCSSGTMVQSKVRTVFDISLIEEENNCFKLSICGNGFLYNMVRIIAGTIIDVGLGKIDCNQISNIICSKNRNLSGKTAPACGLCLKKVEYV